MSQRLEDEMLVI